MGEYIPRDIHEQMWHPRNGVLGQLSGIFKAGALNGEVLFPCVERSGPVPLMAGVVESPDDFWIDRSNVEMYDISTHEGHAFRIDLFHPDEPETSGVSYVLSRQAGVCAEIQSKSKPLPLESDDYFELGVMLDQAVLSLDAAGQVLNKLNENRQVVSLDDYLARYMGTRRQRAGEFLQRWARGLDIYGFWTGMSGPLE